MGTRADLVPKPPGIARKRQEYRRRPESGREQWIPLNDAAWRPNPRLACHAEGRGLESHHPLLGDAPLRRGFPSPGQVDRPRGRGPVVAQTAVETRGAMALTWLIDFLDRLRQRRVEVHLRVHRAEFVTAPERGECYFLNVFNASPERAVTVTHVWIESEPATHAIVKPLPARIEPGAQWETWVVVAPSFRHRERRETRACETWARALHARKAGPGRLINGCVAAILAVEAASQMAASGDVVWTAPGHRAARRFRSAISVGKPTRPPAVSCNPNGSCRRAPIRNRAGVLVQSCSLHRTAFV